MQKTEKALVFQGLFLMILYRVFIGKEAITLSATSLSNKTLYRVFIGKEAITPMTYCLFLIRLYRVFIGKEAITL